MNGETLEVRTKAADMQRTKQAAVREYRRPELHTLGSLEQVQRGSKGNNYDGASRWWYYE